MKPSLAAGLILAVLAMDASRPLAALEASRGLSAADEAKIRAVSEAYCAAWLANDEAAVLALFSKDAVLLPHHGLDPVAGQSAIRAFWFPKDGPPTTVTVLTQRIDEVGGTCDLAYMRGHSTVSWTSGKGPAARVSSNAGTFLNLLRRQPGGSWLITHQMWDDPTNPPR